MRQWDSIVYFRSLIIALFATVLFIWFGGGVWRINVNVIKLSSVSISLLGNRPFAPHSTKFIFLRFSWLVSVTLLMMKFQRTFVLLNSLKQLSQKIFTWKPLRCPVIMSEEWASNSFREWGRRPSLFPRLNGKRGSDGEHWRVLHESQPFWFYHKRRLAV